MIRRILFLQIFLFLYSARVWACDGGGYATTAEHIAKAKVIAFGYAVSAELLDEESHNQIFGDAHVPEGLVKVRFETLTPIKGVEKNEIIVVYYHFDGSSCSIAPTIPQAGYILTDEIDGYNIVFLGSQDSFQFRSGEYFDIFEEMTGEKFDRNRWIYFP